jgi:hypothetical protein
MRRILRKLVLSLLIPTLLPCAFAQEPAGEDVDETIDEITVMGARSLAMMRAEVIKAEDAIYELFNELNDDDGYDIICKKETRIGSQIPQRVCLARMYRDEVAMATVDQEGPAMPVGNMTRSSRNQAILIDKMRALANEHPELLDALKKRYALDQRYKEQRDRRYEE